MKSKFLSALSVVAIALISTTPLSEAKVYTAAQFNAELKAKVGTKKNASAFNAAAKLYKQALGDKKNKKLVVTFTKSVLKALGKSVVVDGFQGKSRATLAKALADGYFKGITYNGTDSKYLSAIKLLSGKLPISQQTIAVAQLIAAPLIGFNSRKGGPASTANAINGTVYNTIGVATPTPES